MQAEMVRLGLLEEDAARRLRERRESLTEMLGGLGKMDVQARLARQELVLGCARAAQAQIDSLNAQIDDLRSRRQEARRQMLAERSKRQTLEKLRQQAFERHRKELDKIEQKQTDEVGQLAFARDLLSESQPGVVALPGKRKEQDPDRLGLQQMQVGTRR